MITDFHTHAFPDNMASRAVESLQAGTDKASACLDGRISSLLASMDKAGIHRSVVCSIATKPTQFDNILKWSKAVRTERIIPLPSVHPRDADLREHVRRIADEGFRGLKLHPYYQSFEVDSETVFPIYEEASAAGLLVVCHTGFDIAFPRDRIADPRRIARVLDAFPELVFFTTHFIAWEDWEEAERHLIGKPVYTDISFALEFMDAERAKKLFLKHPREYLLFGSDSPWQDQGECLDRFRALGLGEEWEQAVLSENAARLLGEY